MKMAMLKENNYYTDEEYELGKSSFNCKFDTPLNETMTFICSINVEMPTHGYYGFSHLYKEDVINALNEIGLTIDADYYVPNMTKWSNYEKANVSRDGKINYRMMSVTNFSFYKVLR